MITPIEMILLIALIVPIVIGIPYLNTYLSNKKVEKIKEALKGERSEKDRERQQERLKEIESQPRPEIDASTFAGLHDTRKATSIKRADDAISRIQAHVREVLVPHLLGAFYDLALEYNKPSVGARFKLVHGDPLRDHDSSIKAFYRVELIPCHGMKYVDATTIQSIMEELKDCTDDYEKRWYFDSECKYVTKHYIATSETDLDPTPIEDVVKDSRFRQLFYVPWDWKEIIDRLREKGFDVNIVVSGDGFYRNAYIREIDVFWKNELGE